MITLKKLQNKIKKNKLKINATAIKKAYDFIERAYQKEEKSKSFIYHCLGTALILTQMKLDASSVLAGLLHNITENTSTTKKEIEENFGKEIAFLVDGVVRLGKIKYKRTERNIEKFRKMFIVMAKDIRIIIIKLAERAEKIKYLKNISAKEQEAVSLEALEVYAPIAHRLRIGVLKGKLEDSAFVNLYPEKYKQLKAKVKEKYQKREVYLKKIIPIIKQKIEKDNIKVLDIHARAKRDYSLYQKLEKHNTDLSEIYDLIAVRIIVPSIKDCYGVLGTIHKNWEPLPGRIKDYISTPKSNGYQSLHTTVFCAENKITEFQIRTPKIHWEAEYGITAHWTRPEKNSQPSKLNLDWLREIKKWQKRKIGSKKTSEINFFKSKIFVFTPKGDIIELPKDSTPIDFAYSVHTELGHKCGEAKIDGKMSSLKTPLYTGQVVEILPRKKPNPSWDWLKFIKTNYAKNKIKSWRKININKK